MRPLPQHAYAAMLQAATGRARPAQQQQQLSMHFQRKTAYRFSCQGKAGVYAIIADGFSLNVAPFVRIEENLRLVSSSRIYAVCLARPVAVCFEDCSHYERERKKETDKRERDSDLSSNGLFIARLASQTK